MSGYEPDDPLLRMARKAAQGRTSFMLILGIGLFVLLSVVLFVVMGG